LAPTA